MLFRSDKNSNTVVWDAFIENKPTSDAEWKPLIMYKAHYISSLYPCYFTLQNQTENFNSKSPVIKASVFNEGSETDSYEVTVLSE